MADIVSLLVIEALRKGLAYLKAKVFYNNRYGPWTFIGKQHYNYELNRLRDRHEEQVHHRPIIRKVVDHGNNEEAASRWWQAKYMSVSYGPVYRGLESETWKNAKQEAWEYLLRSSNDDDDQGGAGTGADETTRLYIEAITAVEVESRALYGGDSDSSSVASLSSEEFIWIMILDGCFLLQVALFVLGGSKQLDYPIDVQTFGLPPRNKELIRAAISSMFIVGNQIPILVLKELMKQRFFKKIVEQGKWKQPLDLERWVLFEHILVPMLDVEGGDTFIRTTYMPNIEYIKRFALSSFLEIRDISIEACIENVVIIVYNLVIYSLYSLDIYFKKRNPSVVEAYDLLEGLWSLMSGLSPRYKRYIDHQINSNNTDDIEDNSYDMIRPTVRSATELKEAGITFKCIEGTRIKEISLERSVFNTFLKLPKIIIGSEMELLFSNLVQYEVSREDLGENRRKICAYLQLLRELIRTHYDVKLLAASGIIIVDPNEEEQLPNMLRTLDISKVNADRSLSKVRDLLNNYTRPSMYKKLGDLLSLVALLTIIQTVYAVLSYHLKK